MLYAFTELQDIQDDIFALNAYYLPLAEEGAQLDSSIRQLSMLIIAVTRHFAQVERTNRSNIIGQDYFRELLNKCAIEPD